MGSFRRVVVAALFAGVAAAIPCAVGAALFEHYLNRGIGIFGPSPPLAALFGALIGGFLGGIVGVVVAVAGFRSRTGAMVGAFLGAVVAIRLASDAFLPNGYVDRERLVTGVFEYAALVVGLGLSGFLAGRLNEDKKRAEESPIA